MSYRLVSTAALSASAPVKATGAFYWMRVTSYLNGATYKLGGQAAIACDSLASYQKDKGAAPYPSIELTGDITVELGDAPDEVFTGPVSGPSPQLIDATGGGGTAGGATQVTVINQPGATNPLWLAESSTILFDNSAGVGQQNLFQGDIFQYHALNVFFSYSGAGPGAFHLQQADTRIGFQSTSLKDLITAVAGPGPTILHLGEGLPALVAGSIYPLILPMRIIAFLDVVAGQASRLTIVGKTRALGHANDQFVAYGPTL